MPTGAPPIIVELISATPPDSPPADTRAAPAARFIVGRNGTGAATGTTGSATSAGASA